MVDLDLHGRGLAGGAVAAALGGLTVSRAFRRRRGTLLPFQALKGLHLHANQLTSVPAELGGLTALETLHLDWNQLTKLPAELGRLTALKG